MHDARGFASGRSPSAGRSVTKARPGHAPRRAFCIRPDAGRHAGQGLDSVSNVSQSIEIHGKAIRKGVNRIASKKDSPQRNSPSAASGLRPLRAESFAETPHVAEAFFGGASGDQPGCARRSASQPSKRRKRRFRNHSSSPDLRRNHPPPSAKRSDVHRNQTKCSSCSISLNDPVSIPIVFP